jgi:hypothetical protein
LVFSPSDCDLGVVRKVYQLHRELNCDTQRLKPRIAGE